MTALLLFVFLRICHYIELYHMATQVLLSLAAALNMQLFISPVPGQAGGPGI